MSDIYSLLNIKKDIIRDFPILANRVADAHASMVTQYLKKLKCPTEQKVQLLDAVIDSVAKKQKAGEPTL